MGDRCVKVLLVGYNGANNTGSEVRLIEIIKDVQEIMENAGVSGPFVEGLLNAGHLGGTVPLRMNDVGAMRPEVLPDGLWISDLSLVLSSQGFPTMLTTAAISLRVSRKILETLAR